MDLVASSEKPNTPASSSTLTYVPPNSGVRISTTIQYNDNGQTLCKVEGCGKNRQSKNDGFCRMHFNTFALAEGEEMPSNDASPPSAAGKQSSPSFQIGDRIEARYQGRGRRYYPGVIVNVVMTSDGETRYDVDYDDSDKDRGLSAKFIRQEEAATDESIRGEPARRSIRKRSAPKLYEARPASQRSSSDAATDDTAAIRTTSGKRNASVDENGATNSYSVDKRGPGRWKTKSSCNHTTGQEHTGLWTAEEEGLFLRGLEQYGKGAWTDIAALVKSRNSEQVRVYANNYFASLAKKGQGEMDSARAGSVQAQENAQSDASAASEVGMETSTTAAEVGNPDDRDMNMSTEMAEARKDYADVSNGPLVHDDFDDAGEEVGMLHDDDSVDGLLHSSEGNGTVFGVPTPAAVNPSGSCYYPGLSHQHGAPGEFYAIWLFLLVLIANIKCLDRRLLPSPKTAACDDRSLREHCHIVIPLSSPNGANE